MLINLSKLLSGDLPSITEQVTVEMENFACSLGIFPITGNMHDTNTTIKYKRMKTTLHPFVS